LGCTYPGIIRVETLASVCMGRPNLYTEFRRLFQKKIKLFLIARYLGKPWICFG
jgi:hypothetical protein